MGMAMADRNVENQLVGISDRLGHHDQILSTLSDAALVNARTTEKVANTNEKLAEFQTRTESRFEKIEHMVTQNQKAIWKWSGAIVALVGFLGAIGPISKIVG